MRVDSRLTAEPEHEQREGVPRGRSRHGATAFVGVPLPRRRARPRLRIPSESEPLEQVRNRERNYRHALAVSDMAAAALAVPLAIGVVGGDQVRWSYLILLPLMLLTAKVLGLYDHDELVVHKSTLDELPRLINLASAFTLLVWLTRHLTVVGAADTAALAALWISLAASISGGRALARRLAAEVSPDERCLVLGDGRAYGRVSGAMANQPGLCLVGSLGLDVALHDASALRQLAAAEQVHRIIIASDDTLLPEHVLELVRRAKATGLRVSLLPGLLEAAGSSVVCDDIGGVTLLGVPRFGLTRSSTAVKRGFDLLGASILLLLAAPIVALSAVLIRAGTPGPVFFRQTRVGREGEHFQMIKLRTMVDGAEALKAGLADRNETNGVFKIADDPRITRVGAFLRHSNFDELPQLINVLRGDMSLVGPRPLVTDEDERVVGLDRRRLHLKPGMTGPWQTLGNRVPLAEMVKVDYLYIANWSLWLDVKILLRTVPQVAQGRGR